MQNPKCNNILIINDSPTLNTLLQLTLEGEGYSIAVAETGLDGIEKAKAGQYHLILLDYNLPDINGIEVCRRLRKEQVTKKTPIAFVSGTDEEELSGKIKDAGANAFIDPPFTGEVFMEKLKELLH